MKKRLLLLLLVLTAAIGPCCAGSPTKNDFKITMLSLGSGSSRFTYERAFNQYHSAEFTVGIIGWGWDWMNKTEDSRGMLYKLAFKWNVIPQRSADSWLAGFYLKPELVVADFRYVQQNESDRKYTTQTALLAECGYQLVLGHFLLDVYCGMGGSVGDGNDNNYFHSFMLYPKESNLAFTAGYRIGFTF